MFPHFHDINILSYLKDNDLDQKMDPIISTNFDSYMKEVVALAGRTREEVVTSLRASAKEPSREVLEGIINCLELDYQPQQRVVDFLEIGIYLQRNGHKDAACSLYRAIITKTLTFQGYYQRIA